MKKSFLLIGVFSALCFVSPGYGQSRITEETNQKELKRLSTQFEKEYKVKYKKAYDLALSKKNYIEHRGKDGSLVVLQGLDDAGKPLYYVTNSNLRAAATISASKLWQGGSLGLSLNGAGSLVANRLGVWDGGKVRETHQELLGRVTQMDRATSNNDHATHVSGTLIGGGINSAAKGMAWGAKLKAWDFTSDGSEMAAAANDLLLSNHSYGAIAGWRYTGDPNRLWEWWGEPGVNATEDWKFGFYDSRSREWDQLAYAAPYYLIVKSAGNNRNQNGPAAGQSYFLRSTDETSTQPRSLNNGYDVISLYGNAKNILTVGAAYPLSDGYKNPSDVVLGNFSSWGPTDDGRIKPDIVAAGVDLLSSTAASDESYSSLSGTSMAAPNTTGALLLLQEHYSNLNNGELMRSATLKGLVIHTADEAGPTPGPDYQHGWGLLNIATAAEVISNTHGSHMIRELSMSQGGNHTINVVAKGTGPLKATICWTDPEGNVFDVTAANINNRTPKLINDLDITVLDDSQVHRPWMLNPDRPAEAATRGDNIRDNVEQVLIENAIAGKTYTIVIRHKNTLLRGPQSFSLIVSGIGGAQYCTVQPQSRTSGVRINTFKFGALDYSKQSNYVNYRDLTSVSASVFAGQTISLDLQIGTEGTDVQKAAKVYIDWNLDGQFSESELVASQLAQTGNISVTKEIRIPYGIRFGQTTRMRVVAANASALNEMSACNCFDKGEVHDYAIRIQRPVNDVGIVSLVTPGTEFCVSPYQGQVSVLLHNFGTAEQKNVPVKVDVLDGTNTIATLTGEYRGSLKSGQEVVLVLPGSFTVERGKSYTFRSNAMLSGDTDPTNDVNETSRTVFSPVAPNVKATYCGTSAVVLNGSGEGTLFWYSAPTGGTFLGAGNRVVTNLRPDNRKFYAAINEFKGKFGPATNKAFTGGSYNQFTPAVLVTAHAPAVLEKARMYFGNSGTIEFLVESVKYGTIVSSVELNVTATRTPAAEGLQEADPNDNGTVVDLNLEFPEAGDYRIHIYIDRNPDSPTFSKATLYRSNQGVKGYPFTIPGLLSITGNTATVQGGVGPLDYYYYFYDMEVAALGCPGLRVEASVEELPEIPKPAIEVTGRNLDSLTSSSEGSVYQWYFNNEPIQNANRRSILANKKGQYRVQVTNGVCISALSDVFNFETTEQINIFPNPVSRYSKDHPALFEIAYPKSGKFTANLYDMQGRHVMNIALPSQISVETIHRKYLDLDHLAPGIYLLKVESPVAKVIKKVIVL